MFHSEPTLDLYLRVRPGATLAGVADEPGWVGVPWRDWQDTQTDLMRMSFLTAIALLIAGLTLLALMRKGVLSAADLYPLAAT